MKSIIETKGYIEGRIKYKDGRVEVIKFNNTIVAGGKQYLANCLLEDAPKLHVKHMLFGDGGTMNGEPKLISPAQEKLFGVTRVKKEVIAQVDPEMSTQLIFSIIIGEDEGNDFPLNEMALELSDGTISNLATFADLNKTDQMEIAWSWFICFV